MGFVWYDDTTNNSHTCFSDGGSLIGQVNSMLPEQQEGPALRYIRETSEALNLGPITCSYVFTGVVYAGAAAINVGTFGDLDDCMDAVERWWGHWNKDDRQAKPANSKEEK